jgi:hypothetical protein
VSAAIFVRVWRGLDRCSVDARDAAHRSTGSPDVRLGTGSDRHCQYTARTMIVAIRVAIVVA